MKQIMMMVAVVGAFASTAAVAQQPARPAQHPQGHGAHQDPQPSRGADSVQRRRAAAREAAKIAVKDKDNLMSQAHVSGARAKEIALLRVPGKISTAELHMKDDRLVYDIKIIPDRKKTYTGVSIDAHTGAIIGVKQFGGVRGAAGYARESAERKVDKSKKTTDGDRKTP